jgi:hypothetical protein
MKVWVVQAKAPDHRGGERSLICVEVSEDGAHRQALAEILGNEVQDDWSAYKSFQVKRFRQLIESREWKAAVEYWSHMSDYEIEIEEADLDDGVPDSALTTKWP